MPHKDVGQDHTQYQQTEQYREEDALGGKGKADGDEAKEQGDNISGERDGFLGKAQSQHGMMQVGFVGYENVAQAQTAENSQGGVDQRYRQHRQRNDQRH